MRTLVEVVREDWQTVPNTDGQRVHRRSSRGAARIGVILRVSV
jgi:hypothetical protein